MKVLVATKLMQGRRKNDFCFCDNTTELVVPKYRLNLGEYADDELGEARSFFSLTSGKSTTTARIMEIGISESRFQESICDWLARRAPDLSVNYAKQAYELCQRVIKEVAPLPFGSVVECRDLRILLRR